MLSQRPLTTMSFGNFLKNINITAREQDIDEFVAIDDENSHVFQEEILEEANSFFLKNRKREHYIR